jgi:type III secretion protein V
MTTAAAPQPLLARVLSGVAVLGNYSVIILLLIAVMMMILPLPPEIVDVLIGFNVAVTALVLMLAMNITRAVEFASLPSVILVITVFRMSIEITTSRSILVEGDAGEIVRAFGEFVIGGNLLAGVVIFMIITIVQFLVITKGSERVAEVAARFTLDAMPGKQLAIDNDLRNGDITQAEATRLRRLLGQENQLFGAMDGAMKFVKGDAMAGMAIVVINLVGGIVVGVIQHHLSFGEAVRVFSLQTVGSGLISQIPALFMSIASGTIITRVTGGDSNLGVEIAREFAKPRALASAAVILSLMTLVPHFPVLVFAGLGATMGGLAWLAHRHQRIEHERAEAEHGGPLPVRPAAGVAGAKPAKSAVKPSIPLEIGLGAGLAPLAGDLAARAPALARRLQDELGIDFPVARVDESAALGEREYELRLDRLPEGRGTIPANRLLVRARVMDVDLLGIAHEELPSPMPSGAKELWADEAGAEALAGAGIKALAAAEVLEERLAAVLMRSAAQFLGIQEAKNLLAAMEAESFEDLVREVSRAVPLQRFTDVLKRLLDERISIRNRRLILEALVEWGPKEQDPAMLAEYVRGNLKRQISHMHAGADKAIAAILLQRDTEDMLRAALRQTAVGTYLTLSDADAARLIAAIRDRRPDVPPGGPAVVVLTSLDVRRFLRGFLIRNELDLPVLSFQDIAADYVVRPVATVALADTRAVSPPTVPAAA